MTRCRAWIERVELPIHDAIERHRASSGTNHHHENQPEYAPARPTAIFPRCHTHRRQCERQSKDRVRETHEAAPLLKNSEDGGWRIEDGIIRLALNLSTILHLQSSILIPLLLLLRPARREFVWQAHVIKHSRHHSVHELNDRGCTGIKTWIRRNQRRAREQQ